MLSIHKINQYIIQMTLLQSHYLFLQQPKHNSYKMLHPIGKNHIHDKQKDEGKKTVFIDLVG
jgi:hypothetical protein